MLSLLLRLRPAPPYSRKIAYLVAVLTPGWAWAVFRPEGASLGYAHLGIGVSGLHSLWLLLFSSTCLRCDESARLAEGLPLDLAGTLFYGGVFAAFPIVPAPRWLACAVCFASGAHLVFLGSLVKMKALCWLCVLIALSVSTATGLVGLDLHAFWTRAVLCSALGAAAAALKLAIPHFRRRRAMRSLQVAHRLAREAVSRKGVLEAGKARVVVYNSRNCAVCLVFESILRPALEQEFEDAVESVIPRSIHPV